MIQIRGGLIIVPPAIAQETAEERVREKGYECTDWFFCKKDL